MGNSLSAAATERVLNLFKPDFAFFVGIAGGLRDDLKIGDVVAASKVYGYEGGKSGATFQPRPEAPPVSHAAEQRANAVVRDKVWQKRITPSPRTIPDAIVRPIAAGEKVLVSESSEDLKRVRTTYTDAHAVAMEDHGFATAVRAHPSVCFAVVRGISDLIENKQEADRTGSHDIAARNAAAFAFEMLAGLLRGRASAQEEDRPFID
jgi:nucleoside phosphorylase